MKRFISFLFFLSVMTACTSPQTGPEPAPVTHTYIYSDASILNPERGFFTPYELPGSAGFSPVRATGNTLVHLNIRLDDWREIDIPQDVLNGLQTNFDDIRDGGVKAILRFAYNQGPYPDSEPDASKQQILRHIEQLTPLLQNNADVIAWLEAGFIGAWGEWHTSTNGLDNIADKKEILFALLKALPETRTVQVRYPANIIEMFPNALAEEQAFDGSDQSRVAHHNDCFLSSNTDVGTYERDGTITIERDQAYLSELTRFTPMSGETCAPNPPRSECTNALKELALLHFSAINEAYHKGIIRSWEDGGCMEEITNRMGYGFFLTTAHFNEQVRPGGVLDLTAHINNIGFASIINERPLYVVLVAQDDILRYEIQLDIDPRRWEPGITLLKAKLHIPSNVKVGEYRLALWFPDGYESLRDDPMYSIQFANENIWDEAKGLNVLGNVSIAESAGGESERGNELSVVSVESQTVRETPLFSPTSTPALNPSSSSTDLISNTRVEKFASNFVIQFEFTGEPSLYNGFQVLLDTDQDPTTGMSIEGAGADFLLENDTLNVYAGTGSDWGWAPVDVDLTFTKGKQIAKWTLPGIALGDSANMDVVFQLVDLNWNTAYLTSKQTFKFK